MPHPVAPPPTRYGSTAVQPARDRQSVGIAPPPTTFGSQPILQTKPAKPGTTVPPPPTRYAPGAPGNAIQPRAAGAVPPPPTTFSGQTARQPGPPGQHRAPPSPPVVQRAVTIAKTPITKVDFIKATVDFRPSERRALRVLIETHARNFSSLKAFTAWARRFRGFQKRVRARDRGQTRRKTGYVGVKLAVKHRLANHGITKSNKIRDLLLVKRKPGKARKKVKIAKEVIGGMFGNVTLYDQGNFDPTPFTTAKLSDFGHDPKKHKRAPHAPRSKKAATAYVQLIHDIKNSGVGDKKMAGAMLSYLNDEAWKIDETLTSYVKKSASVFLAATQASEEGRNAGAAKYARTLLRAIQDGNKTFANCFGDVNSALYTPALTDGSGKFGEELDKFDEDDEGHLIALEYQSDSSDDEKEDDYDVDKDEFWE